jgi:hypothetical protein
MVAKGLGIDYAKLNRGYAKEYIIWKRLLRAF